MRQLPALGRSAPSPHPVPGWLRSVWCLYRGIQGDSEPRLVSAYPAERGRKHQFWELYPCLHQGWLARPHCTQPGGIRPFILPFSKYLWNPPHPCCVPGPVLGCRAIAANKVGIASGLVGAGFLWGVDSAQQACVSDKLRGISVGRNTKQEKGL